jgi:hypothetical protein
VRERAHWLGKYLTREAEETVFVIYNIYNNYIINNKSDKIEILKIRMVARHWQWCVYILPKKSPGAQNMIIGPDALGGAFAPVGFFSHLFCPYSHFLGEDDSGKTPLSLASFTFFFKKNKN